MPTRTHTSAAVLLLAAACAPPAIAQEAPEFEATDITTWTPAQQEALGVFRRWVPSSPAGAPAGFVGEARSGNGLIAGSQVLTNVFVQGTGVIIDAGIPEIFSALGTFNWQRTEWDGTDWHFYNGFVNHAHGFDVNCHGRLVGDSTMPGSGSYSYEHDAHAVLADRGGTFVDLTPTAHRAAATGINNSGEIVLWITEGATTTGFRRAPDGSMTRLDGLGGSCRPERITERGLVVGSGSDGIVQRSKAFASVAGSACVELVLPATGTPTDAVAVDANEARWVVGDTWDFTQSYEHFATIWIPAGTPSQWEGHDLNELLVTPDILLERALAVAEDGRIIARGRPDGSDAFGSRLYLLTPSEAPTPPCAGDINGDGSTDASDFVVLAGHFGDPTPLRSDGDLTCDGVVDAADFVVLAGDFGCLP